MGSCVGEMGSRWLNSAKEELHGGMFGFSV